MRVNVQGTLTPVEGEEVKKVEEVEETLTPMEEKKEEPVSIKPSLDEQVSSVLSKEKEEVEKSLKSSNTYSIGPAYQQDMGMTRKSLDKNIADLKRFGTKTLRNLTELVLDDQQEAAREIGVTYIDKETGEEAVFSNKEKRQQANRATENIINKFLGYPKGHIDFVKNGVTDKEGKILPSDSTLGVALDVGSVIGGGYGLAKAVTSPGKTMGLLEGFIGFELSMQTLGDYDFNLFNLAKDFMAEEVSSDMQGEDGRVKSDQGWLGPIVRDDGKTMTEYSIGVNIDGNEVTLPTMVPTLTKEEIETLRTLPDGERVPSSIVEKAVAHAMPFIDKNESPFYQDVKEDQQGTVQEIISSLAVDEDSSMTEKRVAVFIESVGIGAAIKMLTLVPSTVVKLIGGKRPEDMTDKELQKAWVDTVEKIKKDNAGASEKGLKQIKAQASENKNISGQLSSWLVSVKQQAFTSRGYADPIMYKAMLEAQYAQRQTINTAEMIGARMDSILLKIDSPEMLEKTQGLLKKDLSEFLEANTFEDQVALFSKKENIPEDLATEILDARTKITSLSDQIANTPGFSNEAKESILANMDDYLRRSYKAYENPGYVPSTKSREDLVESIYEDKLSKAMEKLEEEGGVVDFTSIQKLKKKVSDEAKNQVEKLEADFPDDYVDFVAQSRSVNKIFQKNEKLSPEMRAFLGEIDNPSDNVVLTIAKQVRILEMQKFYNMMSRYGNNKFIFGVKGGTEGLNRGRARDAGEEYGTDIFTTKIEGTNSRLDGKYTTKEVADFIYNKEKVYMDFIKEGTWADTVFRAAMFTKGGAQALQTVGSVRTQARNFAGSYQYTSFNGAPIASINSLATDVLKNRLFNKAGTSIEARKLSDAYGEYLGLGVINTDINVNQFREMIELGMNMRPPKILKKTIQAVKEKSDVLNKATNTVLNSGPARLSQNALRKPTEFYQAGDDFWKIGMFEHELKVLKEAWPNADVKVLKQRAAEKVQDTMPNYNKVPKAIQALRAFPLGTYVAYPSEVIRTTGYVFKTAFEEIASPNAVIRQRGVKRLTGAVFTPSWSKGLSLASVAALNYTQEEVDARRRLGSVYSDGLDTVYIRSDGGTYAVDTKTLNSHDYLISPIAKVYTEIIDGNLKGNALNKILLDATAASFQELLKPYISQPLSVGPAMSLATAMFSENGKDNEGNQIRNEAGGIDWELWAKINRSVFLPGTFNDIIRRVNINKPRSDGTYPDPLSENVRLSGLTMRPEDYEDLQRLGYFKMANITGKMKNNKLPPYRVGSTGQEAEEDLLAINAVEFQHQQDLHLFVADAQNQLGLEATRQILKDLNYFSEDDVENVMAFRFVPKTYERSIKNKLNEKARRNLRQEDFNKFEVERSKALVINAELENLLKSLYVNQGAKFEEVTENYKEQRLQKSTGGEVSELIPNAPIEPDERINKLTGIPYNEEAGAAYMDTDDPVRVLKMNLGGAVSELSTSDPMGVKASNRESAKVVADVVTDTLPVVGEVKGTLDTVKSIREGDYTGAAVNAGATLLGIVPGVGDAAGRALKTKRKKLETLINKLKTSLSERTEVDTPIRPVPPRQLDEANKDYDERVSLALKTQGVDVSEKLKTGGEYVDPRTNKPLTNRVVSNSVIAPFTQERPVFQGVLQDYSSNTKMLESVKKEAVKKNSDITILKSNLLKNNKYKIVSEDIEGLQDHTDRFGIVTVVGKNTLKYKKDRGMESDHMYGLQVEVKGDAVLERKVTKKKNNKYGYAQPSLKPHFVGDMKQGNKVGEIKVRGKIHPLYDVVRVDAESLSSKTTKAQGGAIKTQLIVFDAELLAEE